MLAKLKKLVKKGLALIPSKLPVGVTEFDSWANSIIDTFDLATKNEDSVKFTLSTVIMHLGPQTAYKSKYFFYLTLQAAAAKQIAGAVFTNIKEKAKQEELKKQNEAQQQAV